MLIKCRNLQLVDKICIILLCRYKPKPTKAVLISHCITTVQSEHLATYVHLAIILLPLINAVICNILLHAKFLLIFNYYIMDNLM